MQHRGRTAPYRRADGAPVTGSIAEVGFHTIGGVEQWIMIRGRSIANPPLILLHGGPGFSETGLFRRFCQPLTADFTLVFWDQRGAGKSYSPHIPPSTMNVRQFVDDLHELVDLVREKLGHDRVTIFGHSWGSVLGVLYAARFPQKVAAYVGSGQLGDWPASEAASYAYVLAAAERQHDGRSLAKLRRIGPPPHSAAQLWTQRMCLQRVDGMLRASVLLASAKAFLNGPEASILDFPGFLKGFRSSIAAMWPEVSRLSLPALVPALAMPVFFFLGRNDHWVPPETSVAYLDVLAAPEKTLLWFEQSGHEPFMDEPKSSTGHWSTWCDPRRWRRRPDPSASAMTMARLQQSAADMGRVCLFGSCRPRDPRAESNH